MERIRQFGTVRCSMISIETSNGQIIPRPAIFIKDNKSRKIIESMVYNRDKSTNTPIYDMSYIEYNEETQSFTVFFNLALKKAVSEPVIYSVDIPVSFFLVARILNKIDRNFTFLVYDGKNELAFAREDQKVTDILFAIVFPESESGAVSEVIDEALKDVSEGIYAASSVTNNHSHHIHQNTEFVDRSIRDAQFQLLQIICALSQGFYVDGWRRLSSFSNAIDKVNDFYNDFVNNEEYQEPENDSEYSPLDKRGIETFISLALSAYAVSNPLVRDDLTLYTVERMLFSQNEDSVFEDIIISNNLVDYVNNEVIDIDTSYVGEDPTGTYNALDPFKNGPAEQFVELYRELEQREPAVIELVRWNFARTEVMAKAQRTYQMSDIIKATLLVISARIAIIHKINPETPIIMAATKFLTVRTDSFPWELLAMSEPLSNYEAYNFINLLETSVSPQNRDDDFDGSDDEDDLILNKKSQSVIYLFATLIQIKKTLSIEHWNLGNIDKRLAEVQVNLRSLPDARSLLISLLDGKTHNETEENMNPEEYSIEDLQTVNRIINTSDVSTLARNVSVIIPLLADIAALRNNINVEEESWNDFRIDYIHNILYSAASGFRRQGLGAS